MIKGCEWLMVRHRCDGYSLTECMHARHNSMHLVTAKAVSNPRAAGSLLKSSANYKRVVIVTTDD